METNNAQYDLLTHQQKSRNMCSIALKYTVNLVVLCMVGTPILLFKLLGQPKERGFYCSDDSLHYPLLDSTISNTALIAAGVSIPAVGILIIELLRTDSDSVSKKLAAIASSIGYFLFGCACIQIVTDLTKYSIGRLRPHFHAACQTDWTNVTCSKDGHSVYVESYTCLNSDHDVVRDARLSFFSGHASFSAFTMIYLIIYLESRVNWQTPVLIKPFIQLLCLLMTVYTSLSRVFDYHHHWSDVLFGFLAGTIMALLVARYVSRLLPTKIKIPEDDDNGTSLLTAVTVISNN